MHESEYLAAIATIFRASPSFDRALENLARMAVPALADACAIQIVAASGNVESVTVARLGAADGDPIASFQDRVPADEARPAAYGALLDALPAGSHLVLPLAGPAAVFGCIAFGTSRPGGFPPERLRQAEDFARGVAQGAGNARPARKAERLEPDAPGDPGILSRSHVLLRSLLGSLADPVAVYERDGTLAYANEAFARFGGPSPADGAVSGQGRDLHLDFDISLAEGGVLAPDRRPAARAWRGDYQQGELMRYLDRRNGAESWMEVTTLPLYGADGEVDRIAIVSHDVTGPHLAHAETRRVRELVDIALDSLQESLVVLDASGLILYLNDTAARFLGSGAAAELIGLPRERIGMRADLWDEEGNPVEDADRAAVEVLRGIAPSVTRVLRSRDREDGLMRWVETRAVAVKDEWGRIRHVATAAADITRHKSAQEALADREEALRLALDAGRVGVWEIDVRQDLLSWSDRMCTLHGRLAGHPPRTQAEFLALIHPDDRARVEAVLLGADARAHIEVEYRVPGRFGEVRWFHSAGGYHRDAGGNALRFLGAALEITDRKRSEAAHSRLQERAREAKNLEMLGRMAGGMSHDFNNLLTAINGYADLILAAAREDREVRGYAGNIRESGERALKITQHLLAYSQQQMLETEIVDANGIIRYMADLVRQLVRENVTVIPIPARDPEPIRVDAGKLKQALLHVVMNGLDAMPDGGRLTLSAYPARSPAPAETGEGPVPAGGYVVIEVADTGNGIDPDILPRIFDPYFTTKPLGVKSGLGLAMVQGIVKQHGGHIRVASEKGAGTLFRLYFPSAGQDPGPLPAAGLEA